MQSCGTITILFGVLAHAWGDLKAFLHSVHKAFLDSAHNELVDRRTPLFLKLYFLISLLQPKFWQHLSL